MENAQKMIQKEVMVEYSLGVPAVASGGELIFKDCTDYVSLNCLIPEELASKDMEWELSKWFKQQWEETQSDCAYAQVYLA